MSNVIAYYRVSTDRQRRSGLGIEAQRTAVHRFAEAEALDITSEYVEAETGKGADALERRPPSSARMPTPSCSTSTPRSRRRSGGSLASAPGWRSRPERRQGAAPLRERYPRAGAAAAHGARGRPVFR
jgi:hypothetical protein